MRSQFFEAILGKEGCRKLCLTTKILISYKKAHYESVHEVRVI